MGIRDVDDHRLLVVAVDRKSRELLDHAGEAVLEAAETLDALDLPRGDEHTTSLEEIDTIFSISLLAIAST